MRLLCSECCCCVRMRHSRCHDRGECYTKSRRTHAVELAELKPACSDGGGFHCRGEHQSAIEPRLGLPIPECDCGPDVALDGAAVMGPPLMGCGTSWTPPQGWQHRSPWRSPRQARARLLPLSEPASAQFGKRAPELPRPQPGTAPGSRVSGVGGLPWDCCHAPSHPGAGGLVLSRGFDGNSPRCIAS